MTALTMFRPVTIQAPVAMGWSVVRYNETPAWEVDPGLAVGRPKDEHGVAHDAWVVFHVPTGFWLPPCWLEPEAAVAAASELIGLADFTLADTPLLDGLHEWIERHFRATQRLSAGIQLWWRPARLASGRLSGAGPRPPANSCQSTPTRSPTGSW